MAVSKQHKRAGGSPPARPPDNPMKDNPMKEETPMTTSYAVRAQSAPFEGIAVVGEAVQRVAPENAEFVIEIATAAPTAAQALRDHQAKAAQIAQAVAPLGVQRTDLQTISMNVLNTYTPLMQGLPPYGAVPQIGPGAFGSFGGGSFGA